MWHVTNRRSVPILRVTRHAIHCIHGMLTGLREADGHRRDATASSVGWHQGGFGLCELCGDRSDNRVLIVWTAAVWRLCDDCAESVIAGDTKIRDPNWDGR